MEMDDLLVRIEEGKSGAPVAVARLAHGPRIDQISRIGFQLQRNRFRLADGSIFRTEAVGGRVVDEKSSLQMRVPKKS